MNPFYNFLLDMWVTKQITEVKLRSYVPFYLSQAECDTILTTPQMTDAQIAMAQAI